MKSIVWTTENNDKQLFSFRKKIDYLINILNQSDTEKNDTFSFI